MTTAQAFESPSPTFPPLTDGAEVMQQGDDVRAIRYKPTDGKGYLHDVQVLFEDGLVVTIGCVDARHARNLWGQINNAAHITHNERQADLQS